MSAVASAVASLRACDLYGRRLQVDDHWLWVLPPEVLIQDRGGWAEVPVEKVSRCFCEACLQSRIGRWRKLALKAAPITAGIVWLLGTIALAIILVRQGGEGLVAAVFWSGVLATFPGIALGGAVFLELNLRAGRWPADLANNNREKLRLPPGYLWDHPPKRVVCSGGGSYRIGW